MKTAIQFIDRNKKGIITDLQEFLSIPSISTDPAFNSNLNEAAKWLENQLRRIGISAVEIIETDLHSIVFAEHDMDPNLPTILFYGHYDVQPADPIELWETPPFEPTIRNGSIFARGATDDKGQLFIILKAVHAYLKTKNHPSLNMKFVFEGEEETGSKSIPSFLKDYKDRLSADVAVICDSAMIETDIPTITYGLKGFAGAEVTLKGAKRDLHSGVYGGGVDNPINVLCDLLSSIKDVDGRITIPKFYDDVIDLSNKEREMFDKVPFDSEKLKSELGLQAFRTEKNYTYLESSTGRPTFDISGIGGGYQGKGFKAVIPATAFAKVSMRLVPMQNPEKILDALEDFLVNNLPETMSIEITRMGVAWPAVADLKNKGFTAASMALERVFPNKTVFMRDGGSLPIVTHLKNILGLDSILMGFGLKSDAPHAPNENFGLDRLIKGIHSLVHFFEIYPELVSKKSE